MKKTKIIFLKGCSYFFLQFFVIFPSVLGKLLKISKKYISNTQTIQHFKSEIYTSIDDRIRFTRTNRDDMQNK